MPDPAAGTTSALAALAERQWRDYRAREPGTCFADPDFALDLRHAYDLQDAVSALRVAAGDRVVGYKVGCTGPGTVAQFDMAGPIRGYLYDSEVRRSGAALNAADFAQLAIEGEMALCIGDDSEIAAAFPVIELHHLVFRAPRKTLAELVANNGLNAGIVLPEESWLSSRSHLATRGTLSVQINDRRLESSDLWPMLGGATASLDWLRHHLSEFGLALGPGQIVLAGTPLGLYPVVPGDQVTVFFDAVSTARCLIA
jgi:2-keto-4-pentenoate hydratase